MTNPLPPAIPAATLVIFRERDDDVPELLIVERSATMAFAAGALVFPGGRVDPGDHALAETLGGDRDETAARIAAIRETIEEVGLAIGLVDPLPSARLCELRAALHAGTPIAPALAAVGAAVAPDRLVPYARWRPAHAPSRVFDTRFYLARLPADAPVPSIDATEHVRLFWASAAAVLASVDAGEAHAIFPTRRNLERLAGHRSFAEAVADAARHPVRTITPWIERGADGDILRIPDDCGYPIVAEPLGRALRG